MSGLPPFDRVSASRLPSGEKLGAPLMPRKLATFSRAPLAMSWMYTAELPPSKLT